MSGEQERLNAPQVSGRDKVRAGVKVAQKLGKTSVPIGDVELVNRHAKRLATTKTKNT